MTLEAGQRPDAALEGEKNAAETPEDFESPEAVERLKAEAASDVAELEAGGLPAAERIAAQLDAPLDEATKSELGAIGHEAAEAQAEVEATIAPPEERPKDTKRASIMISEEDEDALFKAEERPKDTRRASIAISEEEENALFEASEKFPKSEFYLKPTGDPQSPFDKESGTAVKVLKERQVAKGLYGSILEASLEVQGQGGHAKRYDGIIKDYSSSSMISGSDGGKYQRFHSENVLKTHRSLQEAGIPVFKTFRIEKDKPRILMTNGNSDETVLVNVWNEGTTKLEERGQKKLENVPNFDEWADKLFSIVEASVNNGVKLDDDCPFFIVNKKTHDVQTIIGDLDRVTVYGGMKAGEGRPDKRNMEIMSEIMVTAALKFIRNNVKEDAVQQHQDALRARLKEYDARNGITRF